MSDLVGNPEDRFSCVAAQLDPLPDLSYQVIKSSAFWFWRRFLKAFAIYNYGGHLGHVTWTIYINLRFPFLRVLHMKFGFGWQNGFREDVDDGRTPEQGFHISLPFEPTSQVS